MYIELFFLKERKPAGDNKMDEGVTDNKRLTMSLQPDDLWGRGEE